ncbi:hypothetical protein [Nonomuraea sp. JJY05]|uniref:hypothetical protein n=1 Tax=Nonomuraea sp. JJY05 TaxID=3350255 RepID=UPI00373E0F0D
MKIDGCRRIPVAALSEYVARLEGSMSTEDLDFSIYFDASKNAWIAAVSLGFDGAGRRARRKASVVLPRKWQDRPVDEQREQAIKLLTPKVKKLREEAEKGIKTKANSLPRE